MYQQQVIEHKSKSVKSVVLIGQIGSGKTTIFNKCCKKKQQVACGGPSITRNTYLTDSAYGNGFKMLDTPGFGSQQDKIGHAVGILNALAEGPINRLLIVIKLERIDLMAMFLKPIIQNIFRRFRILITVIVTNWDQVIKEGKQIEQTRKNEIQNLLLTYNVNSIIYSQLNTTGEELCNKIDAIIHYSNNEKVELTETEFYNYFDLIEVNEDIEDQLRDEKEKVKVSFKKKTKIIKTFITNFDENDSIMAELMHALSIEIKNFANQTIEQFERQNNLKFSKLYELYNDAKVAYLIDSQLKLELMDEVNQVIQLAQQKMKKFTKHCYNFIKQCPNCKEVWIKVSGCDGQTTCGNFPDQDDKNIIGGFSSPLSFKFNFTETSVNFEKIQKPQTENNTQIYKIQQGKKTIGCGQQIVWSTLPPLSQNIISELLDTGILDYLAKEIPKDIEFNLKKSLEKEIEYRKQDLRVIKV